VETIFNTLTTVRTISENLHLVLKLPAYVGHASMPHVIFGKLLFVLSQWNERTLCSKFHLIFVISNDKDYKSDCRLHVEYRRKAKFTRHASHKVTTRILTTAFDGRLTITFEKDLVCVKLLSAYYGGYKVALGPL
jgi:hypothetical protein